MPPILDVAIGIIFIFLLFSLIVTAANEIWLSILDKRAAFLRQGLEELLHDSGQLDASALLNHGLISSLSQGKYVAAAASKRPGFVKQVIIGVLPSPVCEWLGLTTGTEGVPSYIPGKSFVLALLSLVQRHATEAPVSPAPGSNAVSEAESHAIVPVSSSRTALVTSTAMEIQELHAALLTLPDSKLRQSLLALYQDAAGDLQHFKANVENWFNESMDRVGGWYKRYAQQWLLAIALAVAVACNVNTVQLVQTLSRSPKLTDSVVKQATDYAGNPANRASQASSSDITTAGSGAKPVTAQSASGTASSAAALTEANNSPEIVRFKAALSALQGTGIPIGWSPEQRLYFHDAEGRLLPSQLLTAIAGWLVTALAASLGAPFWFDTLNRFIDLRGVGRAPEEKDPTAPKKRATGTESFLTTGDSRPTQ